MEKISIEEITNFCKRKGFVFRSSDIYGGFAGFWDFGPLGVELFQNIKNNWWNFFVRQKENVVGIEASIISHPRVWKASGHVESFKDIAVKCKKCKKSTKIEANEFGISVCDCGGEYEKIGEFDQLFKTTVGALEKEEAYLRGETAQAMFVDMKLVAESSRMKLPFGIAQMGRCFRNEISPRNFIFRSREFNIAEIEFFINPNEEECSLLEEKHLNLELSLLDAETQEKKKDSLKKTTIQKMIEEKRLGEWHAYWLAEQILWFYSLGLKKIKIREHMKYERAFYSSATFDIDFEYPFGSQEVAGNANRGQYDLNQHIKESGKNLQIYDEDRNEKVVPRVIEPTFGLERIFLATIVNGYEFDEERKNIVLKLPPKIAPIKVAILPLVKKEKSLVEISRKIFEDLKPEWNVVYDDSGSIGRRYSRNDEVGTPFCVTVDNYSEKNEDVTIRNRDDAKQKRIKVSKLKEVLRELIEEKATFDEI